MQTPSTTSVLDSASTWTPRRGRSPATGRIRCLAAQRQASHVCVRQAWRGGPPSTCTCHEQGEASEPCVRPTGMEGGPTLHLHVPRARGQRAQRAHATTARRTPTCLSPERERRARARVSCPPGQDAAATSPLLPAAPALGLGAPGPHLRRQLRRVLVAPPRLRLEVPRPQLRLAELLPHLRATQQPRPCSHNAPALACCGGDGDGGGNSWAKTRPDAGTASPSALTLLPVIWPGSRAAFSPFTTPAARAALGTRQPRHGPAPPPHLGQVPVDARHLPVRRLALSNSTRHLSPRALHLVAGVLQRLLQPRHARVQLRAKHRTTTCEAQGLGHG